MIRHERVVEALNRGLHTLFASDPRVYLIGEDIADPYGGAFKVSKGLSTAYPDRVLATPISEGALLGIGGGLALTGNLPIVEMMFGDFIALGFDQILNFATKSVAMYGDRLSLNLIVRCPVGGGRGYGPTHSQNLQKHFIGIPHLALFELSPFYDPAALLQILAGLGTPSILFEDKVLYTQRMYGGGMVDDLYRYRMIGERELTADLYSDAFEQHECLIIAPGGLVARCLSAARELFIEHEIGTRIIVPTQLYPFSVEPLRTQLLEASHILIVEEGVAGGTWGTEVSQQIYSHLWGRIRNPIRLVHSKPNIIPTAPHLERQILVQREDISRALEDILSRSQPAIGQWD